MKMIKPVFEDYKISRAYQLFCVFLLILVPLDIGLTLGQKELDMNISLTLNILKGIAIVTLTIEYLVDIYIAWLRSQLSSEAKSIKGYVLSLNGIFQLILIINFLI